MKVLFITPFPLELDWGVERLTKGIAEYLRSKGDRADVLSLGKDELSFWKKYLKNEKGLTLLRLLASAPQDRYDVYVCNSWTAPVALKYPREKRVMLLHGSTHGQAAATRDLRNPFSLFYAKNVIVPLVGVGCQNFDSIIAVSKLAKDETASFYEVAASKITVIGPGVRRPEKIMEKEEARKKLRLPQRPTLLFVGRPSREKGFDAFERLCRNISKCMPINAVCAGGSAQGLPGYFLARRFSEEELEAAYFASDIYVCPSRYEGFGLSIIEALAHGLPIVSFDVGIARQAVAERKNGFVARSEEEMGERVCWLLLNPEKMRQFGKKSLEISRKFDFGESMRKYRGYLLGVARKAGAPHFGRGRKAGKKSRKK